MADTVAAAGERRVWWKLKRNRCYVADWRANAGMPAAIEPGHGCKASPISRLPAGACWPGTIRSRRNGRPRRSGPGFRCAMVLPRRPTMRAGRLRHWRGRPERWFRDGKSTREIASKVPSARREVQVGSVTPPICQGGAAKLWKFVARRSYRWRGARGGRPLSGGVNGALPQVADREDWFFVLPVGSVPAIGRALRKTRAASDPWVVETGRMRCCDRAAIRRCGWSSGDVSLRSREMVARTSGVCLLCPTRQAPCSVFVSPITG